MQQIVLLTVGAPKAPWIIEGCRHYEALLRRDIRFDGVEVSASRERDPRRQAEEESRRVLQTLGKRGGAVWVLDERGEELTSQQFAHALAVARDEGQRLLFAIGGAYGFNDAVRGHADSILSLSRMTLPHELCRLLFLEQLYRATQIMKGSGYHH